MRISAVSTDKQIKMRIPQEILDQLKSYAFENGRSFNTEILFRLVKTFGEDMSVLTLKGEKHENI